MVYAEEENFPRGGRTEKFPLKRPKREDNLFSEQPKQKKIKKKKSSGRENSNEHIISTPLLETLSYKKVQEDMIILGCIRGVKDFSIEVELPGLIFGRVNITNISDSFTKFLNKELEENQEDVEINLKKMFRKGQFVTVKVINIESKDGERHILCSLNPKDVNHEKPHNSFQKGMLIWASVQSVLDHGYELNLGVKNCRIFLPFKNVDNGKEFAIGEPLWCIIHKSETTNIATTLRVSSKEQHIKTKLEEIDSLHNIVPGMQVALLIEKVTSTGIEGKFLNNYLGYVDITHIHHLKKLDNYQEGKLVTAYVVYVEPATKVTHLTLRDLDSTSTPKHSLGDIVSGEVLSKVHNGIILKLPTNEKCLVTNKRLLESLPKTSNTDVSKSIQTKFAVGSKHTCRILDYSNMLRVYICGVEQAVLKEKIFGVQDIKVGQLLNVSVVGVKDEGLVVKSGKIRGFVPNLHVANVRYSDNLKKKFKEGHRMNARVFSIDNGNVILTIKSGLVESDKCLTTIEDAKEGEQYPGVVLQMTPTGVLVIFYGGVKGWISKRNLAGSDDDDIDPTQYFYRGQVINPWVLSVKGDKVILAYRQPTQFKKREEVKVGQRINGIVGKIHKDRIDVKSVRGKIIGSVPVTHLSSANSLCSTILKTYKTGDAIKGLLCIYNAEDSVLLSRREAMILKTSKKKRLREFKNIKPGMMLRCSYISDCESGIYVLPLLLDYTENVLINKKDVASDEVLPKFKNYQNIIAKVLEINHESRNMRLTVKMNEVYDNRVETTVRYFSQYLADLKYLRQFGYENKWELCQYRPGERVMCKVEQLGDGGGCLVTLPNNVKGLVAPRLCPGNIEEGQTLEGVFLSQDFQDNYVEVCLKQNISEKINKIQDGVLNTSSISSCIAETILVKNDSIISVLKTENCRRQLVYIPLYLSENGSDCRNYYENEKYKVCICGKVGQYLIGMSKKLFMTLDKQTIHKKDKAKSKIDSILSDKNGKKKVNKDKKSETSKNIESTNDDSVESDGTDEEIEEHKSVVEQEDDESDENELVDEETESSEDEETDIDNDVSPGLKRKRDETVSSKNIKFGDDTVKNFHSSDPITGPLPVLPGMSSFFKSDSEVQSEHSSDEEEENVPVKKKKLSAAERARVAREEEERISRIERELADSTNSPKSAEQFDRLLLANPNSSELWTKYMSFHIAATEFDKARSVANRALESIDVTLTDERFNVWLALLNLENMLGTKESFEKTFEEAVRCNDSLKIYLKVIELLADANKYAEMEEKIRKVKNKHKQDPSMWLEIAKTLYTHDKLKEARNIKEAALKSIQDKKIQLNLIVRFAILEFKYGEEEQGAAIFETILSSDPRKVSIWSTYVDQLVNKKQIDQARRVLERSVCQRLPLKSMKTLFLKFRMFEEKHGTPASVEAVKEKAKEYVTRTEQK